MKRYQINNFLAIDNIDETEQLFASPPEEYPIFDGAYYYKLVTGKDLWLGMEIEVQLPSFDPDLDRYEFYQQEKRYLDTPSVYFGGSSDYETDIGFGFFRGIIHGKMTKNKITFRPFWRTIYMDNGKEANTYLSTSIEQTEYYFFPGDRIRIHLVCLKEDELSLRMELIEPTKIYPYTEYREQIKQTQVLFIDGIRAPGNGKRLTEYKIVAAIDQYHNEGKRVQMTNACSKKTTFRNIYLFANVKGSLKKVKCSNKMFKAIYAPSKDYFLVQSIDNGEMVSIFGNKGE